MVVLRAVSTLFLLTSLILCGIYAKIELSLMSEMTLPGRLVLLSAMCLSVYLSSLSMGITLESAKKLKLMKATNWVFFALYIILLVTLVLFDSTFGRNANNALTENTHGIYFGQRINLVPFKGIGQYITAFVSYSMDVRVVITNLFGNLAAFMPFALFLPMLTGIDTLKKFFVSILLIVVGVEILQLITMRGICDIDDVILNVSGALVAYGVFKISGVNRFVKMVLLARRESS